ncbi:MAG: nuclear transport factor 2 family protein [Kofleriaceae bacterium]
MSELEATALAYLDAVASKNLGRVEALVDPDIRFVGPAGTITGVKDLVGAFRRIGAVHVRNDIKRVFSDGNEVCVIYDFVTDTLGAVPTIEWIRFSNGRITTVNLYYDQVPWMTLREELARRAAKARA